MLFIMIHQVSEALYTQCQRLYRLKAITGSFPSETGTHGCGGGPRGEPHSLVFSTDAQSNQGNHGHTISYTKNAL